MQTLGLTRDQYAAYLATLATTHERRIVVEFSDLSGGRRRTLEPLILSGQVVVDAKASPTRILTLSFLDPSRSISFEPDSPGDHPVHRGRLVRVIDARLVPSVGWVECRVFTGVVHDYDREGPVVTITGHGLEVQAQGAMWRARHWPRKTKKTRIIRALLAGAGETRFSIPDLRETTPERLSVMRMDKPWAAAQKLARSLGRQLFYDGRGVATLRKRPDRPVFTFGVGMVLSDVAVDRNPDGIRNTFLVVGGKPKGSKTRVSSDPLFLPKWHPHSSNSLRRNGEPLRLVEREENDQFKTRAKCRERAVEMRDNALRTPVDLSVDVLPVPHLDESDPVRVVSVDGSYFLRADRWTLPLTGEAMSLGAIRRAGAKGGRRKTGPRNQGQGKGARRG